MSVSSQSVPATYGNAQSNITYTVTWTTKTGGYITSGTFAVISGLPAFASASFSPQTITTNSNNATTTLTVVTSANTPAGTYTLTISDGLSHTANGTLTIDKAPLTIIADDNSKCYGTTLIFTGTEFSSQGLVNSNTISSVTLTSSGTVAGASPGNYPILASAAVGTGLSNYTITYENASLTVQAVPTITSTIAGSACGTGPVTLGATASSGTVSWFAAESGGSILGTGNNFTTPAISATTTYYVEGSNGSCTSSSRTAVVATVNRSGYWTGSVSTDWNNSNNWECGDVPDNSTDVLIANGKPRYPVLSSGAAGATKNLVLESAATLTVSANTLKIAGSVNTNTTGTFTATSGTIEMNGTGSQSIPAGTFTGNTLQNLTINNTAGVTLSGALKVSGIVHPINGTLNSNGNLTLLSDAGQTALISGDGSGSVSGSVTIQRYLASAFGYKYFSSPFSNATVGQLSSYLSSTAIIAPIYRYDENRLSAGNAVSGWTSYTTSSNPLNVMEGYAVNLGSSASSTLITMSGTVNNGNQSVTLYNHNRTYTQGFNLVGNPYPSPIDWNAASGWTRSNIDGAIYFFSASGDEYSGVYTSYTNGISGADGDNIIPAMQGFFVHVSSGQSSGTLGMTNDVRIDKPNPVYKSAGADDRKILRFSAGFETLQAKADPLVLYFDPASTAGFDPEADALKLMNTDPSVPSIYALTQEAKQLSIDGRPFPTDTLTRIPLGIQTLRDGWINFSAKSTDMLPSEYSIYLYDSEKNSYNDLTSNPVYRFYLKAGEYNKRFILILSSTGVPVSAGVKEKLFTIARSGSGYYAAVTLGAGLSGTLSLRNMAGQTIREVSAGDRETIEIGQGVMNGVYIVTVRCGERIYSEKTLIRKE